MDSRRKSPGRPLAIATWYLAAIARELIDRRGAYVKDAVMAAAPAATSRARATIERTVRKMDGSAVQISISASVIEAAAQRLPQRRRDRSRNCFRL